MVLSFEHYKRWSSLAKRRRYDATFRAEVLRLAELYSSMPATARRSNMNPKLLYQWQCMPP